jgi:hypothetical protein
LNPAQAASEDATELISSLQVTKPKIPAAPVMRQQQLVNVNWLLLLLLMPLGSLN